MDNASFTSDHVRNAQSRDTPLISIVTVCFNAAAHIAQTIESVLGQSYANIEYIVVDGASTDETLAIIERYADRIARHISEPDDGIADAMNKGLAMATGDFVLFLHADDYLIDDDAICSAVEQFDASGDILAFALYFKTRESERLVHPRGFDWRINFKTGFLHQAVFCRKALFDKIGGFDTSFRIAMDYDFFLRAHRRNVGAKMIDVPIAVMRDTGISSRQDWPDLKMRFAEERRAQDGNCPGVAWKLIYMIYWALYLPYRKVKALVT